MEHEATLRLIFFAATAVSLGLWEAKSPRRRHDPGRTYRWIGNLGVVAVSTVAMRVLFPVLPVLLAVKIQGQGFGLFPALPLPHVIEFILGILLLDAAIYFQHRLFHQWSSLWRLHRMHHADTTLDFTTGVRFHPLEILLSTAFKLALVALIAPSPGSVLAFEIILNSAAMFNHANIFLPAPVDRMLRMFLVTPDMHRIHHSTDRVEMNRNFGFSFAWWDRIFSTYKDQPDESHESMLLGLHLFRAEKYRSLPWLLAIPFISRKKAN
jgi:sterol desaturase/sphingolipid hydroxylase (fatty acid hydroxylase superfamily)